MKNLFFLDAVLSTKIITFIYWIMLAIVVFLGLSIAINAVNIPFLHEINDLGRCLVAVLVIFVGTLIVRMWAEFWVVIFKIQQNTRRTAELLDKARNNNSPL
ncbi:DUF4282 domain-containing protein [Acinetobacter guillouiae]|uniref:DUF4282 domain-containing protein n=1 Tax=Acinetobacter guillouiae TaxID=106649 RepID=UPI00333FF2BB